MAGEWSLHDILLSVSTGSTMPMVKDGLGFYQGALLVTVSEARWVGRGGRLPQQARGNAHRHHRNEMGPPGFRSFSMMSFGCTGSKSFVASMPQG